MRPIKKPENLLNAGQYVLAEWIDGKKYPGRVRSVNKKSGKYDVLFYDNSTQLTCHSSVDPISVGEYERVSKEFRTKEVEKTVSCDFCSQELNSEQECFICKRNFCPSCYENQENLPHNKQPPTNPNNPAIDTSITNHQSKASFVCIVCFLEQNNVEHRFLDVHFNSITRELENLIENYTDNSNDITQLQEKLKTIEETINKFS